MPNADLVGVGWARQDDNSEKTVVRRGHAYADTRTHIVVLLGSNTKRYATPNASTTHKDDTP